MFFLRGCRNVAGVAGSRQARVRHGGPLAFPTEMPRFSHIGRERLQKMLEGLIISILTVG